MENIRGSKNNLCNFGSLITCLFFFVQFFFPSKGIVVWRKDVPILYQINEYIVEMGENIDSIMNNYFDTFKVKMNNRYRIPKKLLQDCKDDICFIVDYDRAYIQAARLRVASDKPLEYEVNIDDTKDIIEAMLNELVDRKAPYFGTYVKAKAIIEHEIKLSQVVNKEIKRIAK